MSTVIDRLVLMTAVSAAVFGVGTGWAAGGAQAASWPMYRCDASRSGYSAEALPANLGLRWIYVPRHAPSPAWPAPEARMSFDHTFQVVVSGETLFFGSSADGKVYALDAATGKERWSFFTDGPVRFAPAIWRDRLFVVSDDGYLYCLLAEDGRLLWRFRGGPSDSLVLGNGRMISRWPARGGPVVADDNIYFAAGIWPTEGIYLYGLDAATGKILWCNDSAGSIYMAQAHPFAYARSGISAQGYLATGGERLFVSTGLAIPAVFRRSDGKILYYKLGTFPSNDKNAGGSLVVLADDVVFNANRFYAADTGNVIARSSLAADVAPETLAVTPACVVYASANEVRAFDRRSFRGKQKTTDFERPVPDPVKTPLSLIEANRKYTTINLQRESDFISKPLWNVPNPAKTASSLIVADRTIIIGANKCVLRMETETGREMPVIAVEGKVLGLAAAGGRLFVSTDTGEIRCYDGEPAGPPKIIRSEAGGNEVPADTGYDATAQAILSRSGVKKGFCVDLGCGDGRLSLALARKSDLAICAVEADPELAERARRRLDAAGLYGVRVTVSSGDPSLTECPPYVADLVVSGRSVIEGAETVSGEEANRLLRPWGGTACIGKFGGMRKTVRGPLENAGAWTHQYANPANTLCSGDAIVRGPLGALWFDDLRFAAMGYTGTGQRPAPLFIDGRFYMKGLKAMRCVNAYTGRTLWEYPLPTSVNVAQQETHFCLTTNGLYLRTGGQCRRINPATGEDLGVFDAPHYPDGKKGIWTYIACDGDNLFGGLASTNHIFSKGWALTVTESDLLFALDAKTGMQKWQYRANHSIRDDTFAVGKERIYLIDRLPEATLLALNTSNGKIEWATSEDIFGTVLALSEDQDALVMNGPGFNTEGRIAVYRASTGKRLWEKRTDTGRALVNTILNGPTVYSFKQFDAWKKCKAYDLLTGQQKPFNFLGSYGCGLVAGSANLLTFRSGTLGYVDLACGDDTENYGGIRPGCWINALPVGGIVLMPNFNPGQAYGGCTCMYLNLTSLALQPAVRMPSLEVKDAVTNTATNAVMVLDKWVEAYRNGIPSYQAVTGVVVEARMTAKEMGDEIRYTLDGSTPKLESALYSAPIRITGKALLRARAFHRGMPPSPLVEAAFGYVEPPEEYSRTNIRPRS